MARAGSSTNQQPARGYFEAQMLTGPVMIGKNMHGMAQRLSKPLSGNSVWIGAFYPNSILKEAGKRR